MTSFEQNYGEFARNKSARVNYPTKSLNVNVMKFKKNEEQLLETRFIIKGRLLDNLPL